MILEPQKYGISEQDLATLEEAEAMREFMDAYEIGGFDMDDRYPEEDYDYYDMDNYGYDD